MPAARPARPVDALRFDTFATPCGPFTVAVNSDGAVVSTVFGTELILAAKNPEVQLARDPAATREARRQLEDYFAGRRRRFALKLAARGTWFQRRVWDELARIPFGETTSYGELAAEVGRPGAARAVGRANATNPICVIVPCHRVIRSDGALTGFAYGTAIKRQLLELEGALPPALL
ncbi:MAG: methylated-DNA--[protein]-cysteine S-methyltransferase [Opitutaceae bacterium]